MDNKMFRKPPLSAFLSGTVLDPSILVLCEALASSGNLLLRMAAIGFLLDPNLKTSTAAQRRDIHERVGLWLDLMPEGILREIEDLASAEAQRQIRNLRDADLSTFDQIKRLEVSNQRKLIEAVNALLLRASRVYVESELIELDDLLPPGY